MRQKLYLRERQTIDDIDKAYLFQAGRRYLSFVSNDFLGLAQHPECLQAGIEAIKKWGANLCSSPLISGYCTLHEELEAEIATFFGFAKAIVFSSGYVANLAIMQAIAKQADFIFVDKENHASLGDGLLKNLTPFYRYIHKNYDDLAKKIKEHKGKNLWLVSNGIFTMTGQEISLVDLTSLRQQYGLNLVIDDAAGIGVLGQNGKGVIEKQGFSSNDIICLTGTFAKAMGSAGAFIAGSSSFIKSFQQTSKPYIYSSALSPFHAAVALQALEILKRKPEIRQHVQNLINYFRKRVQETGLPFFDSETTIQALLCHSEQHLKNLHNMMKKKDLWVSAIRPPSVAPNRFIIRIVLNYFHQISDIDYLIDALNYYWIESFYDKKN